MTQPAPGAKVRLATIIIALAVGACTAPEDQPYARAAQALHQEFTARLRDMESAYRSKNALTYLRATTRALALTNRASIRVLVPELTTLSAAIERDGARPYLPLSIDLGYRLQRLRNPQTNDGLALLNAAVHSSADTLRPEKNGRMMSLIRVRSVLRYRQYDENTAHALQTMLFSSFGKQQVQLGNTPFDLLRTNAMLWECRPSAPRDSQRTGASRKSCQTFTELVARQLENENQGAVLPAVMRDVGAGTLVRAFACFEGTDVGSELVESMEAYTACMTNKSFNPMSKVADGAGVRTNWVGETPALAGFTYVAGSSTQTTFSGPNGNTGTQVDHQYTASDGSTATVSEFSTIVDGVESNGTQTTITTPNGDVTQQTQDQDGNIINSSTTYADGHAESYEKNSDGSTTQVATHSDGTSDIRHTDADGNVSEGHVDSNGQCTGSACTASTPVDETGGGSGCSIYGNPKDDLQNTPVDPLGPIIYPADDAGALDPEMQCLISSVAGTTATACPPSVALCIEPPAPGQCGCGTARAGDPTATVLAGRCRSMLCADGACNPQTGTCGGSSVAGVEIPFCPGSTPIGPRPGPLPFTIEVKPTSTFWAAARPRRF